ncbi:hypothetical protein OG758_12605 [Streptomyces sp. NBC_01474]|nr:hypothetical protein [Streptomyces sp. NBC_01474]WSD94893.1 hypothetical protein OG758_12605 [Streptomyces sp. NBC_01474]
MNARHATTLLRAVLVLTNAKIGADQASRMISARRSPRPPA